MDILALLPCLQSCLTVTTMRHLSRISLALLTMTGRITMRSIARWTGRTGSYRTVQRFFATTIPWAQVMWLFVRQHLVQPGDVYLLAGDEVVVTKAGTKTFGLDRFFAGLYQKPVPGLAFFTLALVSTQARRAFPLRMEQVIRTPAEKATSKAKVTAKTAQAALKRKPGRPKGSSNIPKPDVTLSPELQRIQVMVQAQLHLIANVIPLVYVALDGHFGNHPALSMVRQCGLHLISKLRADAALYFPYDGAYHGHGPHRKYGTKLNPRAIPDQYLQHTAVEGQIETRSYQAALRHKDFPDPVNVVIILKTNLTTHKQAHVLLFSSDLTLPYATLIDYYSLRFQIEFVFRDAKQYWGLEDFMNVTHTAVTNAANLSLFMVNLVYVLLDQFRQRDPHCSVLDLKAACRGYKYVTETIKLLPVMPDDRLIVQIFRQIAQLGSIHPSVSHLNAV